MLVPQLGLMLESPLKVWLPARSRSFAPECSRSHSERLAKSEGGRDRKTVSDLVQVLRSTERLLAAKASDLFARPEWSEVTFRFAPSAWGRLGSDHEDLGFWGYVNAERAGLGGFAWIVDLVRVDECWRVSRALELNRNPTNYQETAVDLSDRTLASTDDLVGE